MRTPHVICQMVRADFLERSRSYSFLILLSAAIYLGFAINTGRLVIRFNICREIFNTAWISAMVAIATNFLLSFFGFFLVKGSIERDGRTGVGQIIAATPLKRIEYVFGKWLSYFVILSALMIVLAIVTVIIQSLRLDYLNWMTLLSPFVWLTLPFLALVAALAVLFETLPGVRGSLGNLIFFFLFLALLLTITNPSAERSAMLTDPSGIRLLLGEIKSAGLYCGEKISLSELKNPPALKDFATGITWRTDILLSRIGIFATALALTAISASFFNRFDSSNEKLRKPRPVEPTTIATDENVTEHMQTAAHLTPLSGDRNYQSNLLALILAEIRLMLKGNHWIWYAGAVLLWIFSIVVSPDSITLWIILLAIWPLLIWSKMGIRESYYRTNQIVFSCAKPLWRLLFASWLAGVMVTALLWSGVAINFVWHGHWLNLSAWLITVLLVPSFALMFGTWTGSSKIFEVFYLVVWYAGIANRLPTMDFIGLTPKAIIYQQPALILFILITCILLGVLGRKQKLKI